MMVKWGVRRKNGSPMNIKHFFQSKLKSNKGISMQMAKLLDCEKRTRKPKLRADVHRGCRIEAGDYASFDVQHPQGVPCSQKVGIIP